MNPADLNSLGLDIAASGDRLHSTFLGAGSAWHWLILAAVVLVLFGGRGKIPALMKDMGKGITAFKKGLKDDGDDADDKDKEKAKLETTAAVDVDVDKTKDAEKASS